ncbi:class I SAM-dependent methyltransferase [Nocardia sp. NPDC049190]|uniref:class I SAM-dependent methyltransferase n=1 Tax=Nocardia sp. NPDC049190 TaxID=3155650 RepID=UPI0033C9E6AD
MRTDDDSWDIVTGVGATALGVAAMRAAESRRPDALFHDPYAEQLVSAVGLPGWRKLVSGDVSGLDAEIARVYGPLGGFLVARTCYFDDYFDTASAAGVRQIVILAAGLDARAYRLDWPDSATLFELDQPKVLEFKASALARACPAVDRREVAVDLRQDWPTALREKGFDPQAPTAWLAEGLLRYLPSDAQDRLFENVVALSAPGSRFAANHTSDTPNPDRLRAGRSRMMATLGIDVDLTDLWYPAEGRSDPVDWFAAQGWTTDRTGPMAVLADRGRAVPEDITDEMMSQTLMTAIRGDSTR